MASSRGGMPPFVFSGIPVDNSDFSMRANKFGYSDSMLDARAQFLGREYLSGEWAGAIYYEGGSLGSTTRWLPERFVFPDYYTPLPHFTSVYSPSDFMVFPNNAYGFPVFGSKITNGDVEIAINYETVDFGAPLAGRLSLGWTPQSDGGPGSFLPSTQFGFKQTWEFKNVSGGTLSNINYYQLLHTLYGDSGVYDARNYGGGMSGYQYGLTLRGESFGLDMISYETVKHTDTVAVKFSVAPVGYELGAFGMKLGGDHQTGEPAVGVHKSISANSLNGDDFFDPDETIPEEDAWVGAAASFNLGSLAPNATVSIDALLAIHTSYEVISPPIEMVVHDVELDAGNLVIDFEETTMNPKIGFILRYSETGEGPKEEWQQAGLPYFNDIPFLGWKRFLFPVDTGMKPNLLIYVQPTIITPE